MEKIICPNKQCRKIIMEIDTDIEENYIECPYCGYIFTKEELGL